MIARWPRAEQQAGNGATTRRALTPPWAGRTLAARPPRRVQEVRRMSEAIALDFYFDVSCRWAWWASVWLRRVAQQRPIAVSWKVFSLAVQDESRRLLRAPGARAPYSRLRLAPRAGRGAPRRRSGALERLYVAYGGVIHAAQGDVRDPAAQRDV